MIHYYLLYGFIAANVLHESMAKRPFYVIGHMVNSIDEVDQFLENGANALESDITFFKNGSVRLIYHGSPCDCHRKCTRSAKLSDYLDHVREVTNPINGKYKNKMIFQFFDLKLTNLNSKAKFKAGQEMADHVLDHLWGQNIDDGKNLVKALIYINDFADNKTIVGFRKRFRDRGMEELLSNKVGYDGGLGDLKLTRDMWKSIGVTSNIWQGDGTINCFNKVYPEIRLLKELRTRDSNSSHISKVYHWTIDDVARIHKSLALNVDGMITNVPHRLVDVLKDQRFVNRFRMAHIDDNPFEKFHSD